MISVINERVEEPEFVSAKEEQDEKNCSSGYDTLSGQTTECDVPTESKHVTDDVICNGSASEDEKINEIGRSVQHKKKKTRQNRRAPVYRDALEADVDSDTTVDSYCDGPRDKMPSRKQARRKHAKQTTMTAKSTPKLGDQGFPRYSSDSGCARAKRDAVQRCKEITRIDDNGNDYYCDDENSTLRSSTPSSPASIHGSDFKKSFRQQRSKLYVPVIRVSGDESSENNSTLDYPSDTISSESSSFIGSFKPKHAKSAATNNVLLIESDSGAKDLNCSLSSNCTSPITSGNVEGQLTPSTTKSDDSTFHRERPDSIHSYEQLIEKIDRKLKQTEKLRSIEENESLKADLRSIQEQINAIKLNSVTFATPGEVCHDDVGAVDDGYEATTESTDANTLESVSKQSCRISDETSVKQSRDRNSEPEVTPRQDIELMRSYSGGQRRCETPDGGYKRVFRHDHRAMTHSSADLNDANNVGIQRVYHKHSNSDLDTSNECSFKGKYSVPGNAVQLQRRRSDPTGLSSKFSRPNQIDETNIPSKPFRSHGGSDVWFALFGKPVNLKHETRVYDNHALKQGFVIPHGIPNELWASPSVGSSHSHCWNSTRSDSRSLSLTRTYTSDVEPDSSFVYPQKYIVSDEVVSEPNRQLGPRQRIPRIKYVDNSEERAIMDSLSTTSKRKKQKDHQGDKQSKKHKPSLIKRVKAGLSVKGAFSKFKSQKPSGKSSRRKVPASYTSQWVGVTSSSEEDHREISPPLKSKGSSDVNTFVPKGANANESFNWSDYRTGKGQQGGESEPEVDPLAHLESGRSQRRGSFFKRIKKWYHSKSKSAENISALDKMSDRFEILNISHSPRRLGSNGPLVNNVIKNRSRSEENLPTYCNSSRIDTSDYLEQEHARDERRYSRFERANSSQSLIDTRFLRCWEDDPHFAGMSNVQDTKTPSEAVSGPGFMSDVHMHPPFHNYIYSPQGQANCPCHYCSIPTPPVHQFYCCNYSVPWYGSGFPHGCDRTYDNCNCNCGQVPRPSSRRHSRSKPSKPLKYERVVAPLEMTMTQEKKAETRKLHVQHTFV